MANRSEGHILSAAPKVPLKWHQKFIYGLIVISFCAVPLLGTVSFIPYMRDKNNPPQQ